MIFLSKNEVREWTRLGQDALDKEDLPETAFDKIRPGLLPHFHYFIGTLLASKGKIEEGKNWLRNGSKNEPVPGNSYLLSYIERHGNKLAMPQITFSDPRPFVHFTTVPEIIKARDNFTRICGATLPKFSHPIKIIDIGCGNGMLLVGLLRSLINIDRAESVGEILLIDPSEKMLELSQQNLKRDFPDSKIIVRHNSLQDVSCNIESHYDIAMSSLAWHHMPFETKLAQARNLSKCVDNFLLFELSANHDTPEQYSPELAISIYQTFGRGTGLILAHDAPKEVAQMSVDYFLMTEIISLLTQTREKRNDHHMLKHQWHKLFTEGLGTGFTCLSDSICYSDPNIEYFSLHYGR